MASDFIYISIPRTGSTSIRSILPQIDDENHKSINLIFRKGFSFGFVRNPFELLVSWHQYHKQHQKQEVYNKAFLNWVFEGCPHHWTPDFLKSRGITHPLNQHEYLCDSEGKIIVDFVGRFETLQKDFSFVCQKIGFNSSNVPYKNNSQHNSWESYYTPKAIAFVQNKFKKDFQIFNFKKYV